MGRKPAKGPRLLALAALGAVAAAPLTASGASAGFVARVGALSPAVTVGVKGNEPLVRVAPDGTLYVAALQHLYVSRTHGRSWSESPGSLYTTTLQRATDSSIQIDSRNRLYMAFDYPYAGTTAVCTSDDHAESLQCNPAVIPGGTDRMWVALKDSITSYLVTNEGLVQTVFAESHDRGGTYTPTQTAATTLNDTGDGALLVSPRTGAIGQDVIDNATNATATTNFESGPQLLRVFDPSGGGAQTVAHPVPLEAGGALPGSAYGRDGTLWVTSERATRVGGKITHVGVQVARSSDDGRTWKVLPEVPGTTTGTSTFVALGAGRAGHVGLIFYRTAAAGDPGSVPATSKWDAVYAESTDALSAAPHWTLTTVDRHVHTGVICATAGCIGSGRFAGDFLDTTFDGSDRPAVVWMRNKPGAATVNEIRYSGRGLSTPAAPARAAAPASRPSASALSRPVAQALPRTGPPTSDAALALLLLGSGLALGRARRRSGFGS
ncbi:MAG: hypothetical protein NVS3B26_22000 [Mycobacteriales bacterium]